MSSSRNNAGRTNHIDERVSIERNDGIHFTVTRKDKRYMQSHGIADIAIFISYPIVNGNNELEYEVIQNGDAQVYIYTHEELIEEGYVFTLAKLIMSTKNPNNSTLQSWINNHTVDVIHSLPKGAAVWIKYPSEANVNDRVCMVTAHYNESAKTLDFLQHFIPKYYIKHIDHTDEELNTTELVISTRLKNDIPLVNGGRGMAADSDIICISRAGDDPKYIYLKIQIFCMKNVCQQYKAHIQIIGQEAKGRVGRLLQSFLSTKYKEKPKHGYVDMGKELREKEFDSQIKLSTGHAPQWTGTKNKKILSIEYNGSVTIFGSKAIVRTFTVRRGTNFILSNTNLTLTYYPNQGRMKIDSFVSHVWM